MLVLGDHDIQSLNLGWLRGLFDTTIFDNIAHGLEGKAAFLTVKELENLVENAATAANAHEFILSLPRGYQTEVGEKGTKLSGGQRQRICIARAIIMEPQILPLDEATSALDVTAERSVQTALAVASKGRTTIVVAHRLSTIRDADNIIVMSNGRVIERGTHDGLIATDGHYAELVGKQRIPSQSAERTDTCEIDYMENDSEVLLEKENIDSHHQNLPGPMEGSDRSPDRPLRTVNTSSMKSEAEKAATSPWESMADTIKLLGGLSRPELIPILVATILATLAGLTVPAYVLNLLHVPYCE